MASNYPPGVSGNEPEITGDWPVDAHAPWVVEGSGNDWYVVFGNDEELVFKIDPVDWAILPDKAAHHIAERLNALTAKPFCCLREGGICEICGDITLANDADYPYLKPVKKADGTYYWLASTSLS